jgi:hypothetical protein
VAPASCAYGHHCGQGGSRRPAVSRGRAQSLFHPLREGGSLSPRGQTREAQYSWQVREGQLALCQQEPPSADRSLSMRITPNSE